MLVITRAGLAEALALAGNAVEVTLQGDETEAILRAVWQDMGYADVPAVVFDLLPAQNPNWIRFFNEER